MPYFPTSLIQVEFVKQIRKNELFGVGHEEYRDSYETYDGEYDGFNKQFHVLIIKDVHWAAHIPINVGVKTKAPEFDGRL